MPPGDPQAQRSRRDLQRLHRVMRSVSLMRGATRGLCRQGIPKKILELGAGDGSLLLRFAQSMGWRDVEVTLLDRQPVVSEATHAQFRRLGWQASALTVDALEWAADPAPHQYDLCFTALFLHHFRSSELTALLRAVAMRCRTFVALEPRRNRAAWISSHLLGLLGANEVTRADGVTSVIAGFSGQELQALWPPDAGRWTLSESFAWPFTHRFVAALPKYH
jgi:2-polyprenyl-3-methyl-5-hydroxy-6-metoxy-1,4-benzoquinol methylase